MNTREIWLPQLSGCTLAYVFGSKEIASKVVTQLNTCTRHKGVHHFAVFHDGLGVALSEVGKLCILEVLELEELP